jgi:hypothetical protein
MLSDAVLEDAGVGRFVKPRAAGRTIAGLTRHPRRAASEPGSFGVDRGTRHGRDERPPNPPLVRDLRDLLAELLRERATPAGTCRAVPIPPKELGLVPLGSRSRFRTASSLIGPKYQVRTRKAGHGSRFASLSRPTHNRCAGCCSERFPQLSGSCCRGRRETRGNRPKRERPSVCCNAARRAAS